MRVVFDGAGGAELTDDAQYAPLKLPGMSDVAQDEQGLLWADLKSGTRAARPVKPEAEPDTGGMFECT